MAQNPTVSDIKNKFKSLWADKRTYKKRLGLSAAVWGLACFTFLFFGPFEMVAFSQGSLDYGYADVLLPLAIMSLVAFLAAASLGALLRGKIYNYFMTVVFSLTIAGYFQANFFNSSLGTLTGDAVDWDAHKYSMILNLIFWAFVLVLVLVLMYIKRAWWRKTLIAVSLALIFVQCVPTVMIFFGSSTAPIGIITDKGMTEYSKKENIFVFVLDRMDYDYIEEVSQSDPEFFSRLDGFTCYTDAMSIHARTQPALTSILTVANDLTYNVPMEDYYKDCWKENGKSIIELLGEAGYDIGMYSKLSYLFTDKELPSKYVSNFSESLGSINYRTLYAKLLNLSAYRYTPTALKPFFWADTNNYNDGIYDRGEISPYAFDDCFYEPKLADAKASLSSSVFRFYHFEGPHPPYVMNEDGTRNEGTTDAIAQLKGNFNNLYRAFEKMKELGIYKDATIIITADHGAAIDDYTALQKATRIGLFYKPSGSEGVELKKSGAPVTTNNIPATILKEAGLDYSKYGKALDEIAEDEIITRVYYKTAQNLETNKEETVYIYNVTGTAADFENWKLVETKKIKEGHNFY